MNYSQSNYFNYGTLTDYKKLFDAITQFNSTNINKQELIIDEVKNIEDYSKYLEGFTSMFSQLNANLTLKNISYESSIHKLYESLMKIQNFMIESNKFNKKIRHTKKKLARYDYNKDNNMLNNLDKFKNTLSKINNFINSFAK